MINFEGIFSTDPVQMKKFKRYIEGKEHLLAVRLYKNLKPEHKDHLRLKTLTLPDVLDRQTTESQLRMNDIQEFNHFKLTINNELWNYLEVLESCNKELFEQLDTLPINQWKDELFETVESCKEFLILRFESLAWNIKRLENMLWDKKVHSVFNPLLKKIPCCSIIDRHITHNIEKNKKFLKFRYEKFSFRFKDYKSFDSKMMEVNQKFEKYLILNILDDNDQKCLKEIYKYIKLWEYNKNRQTISEDLIISSLKNVQGQKKIYQMFYNYYCSLKNAMFHNARTFKLGSDSELWQDEMGKSIAENLIVTNRSEINTLGTTVQKYRDFLLKTDPNPYVRSKLQFSDWAAEEPVNVKRLSNLIFDIENLYGLYEKIYKAIHAGQKSFDPNQLQQANINIQKNLHEMEQPLISEAAMKDRVAKILYTLDDLNELGSFDVNVIPFTEKVLSKILRIDWKYNVAFGMNLFREIYDIHKGLIGKSNNQSFAENMSKIKQNLKEIEEWSKKGSLDKHVTDVEHDISDIQAILQQSLNAFKRKKLEALDDVALVEDLEKQMRQQLLEYRYLFGQFLYELSKTDIDKEQLRSKFLFIHQYLEAFELALSS